MRICWNKDAAISEPGRALLLQLRPKCAFNFVAHDEIKLLHQWEFLATLSLIPRDELALGNFTENSAMRLGAEVSDKLRTQNKNHLGPLSPGAQSIFQEDSSILPALGNQLLPVLLLVFSLGQRCEKANVVLTPPLHLPGSF